MIIKYYFQFSQKVLLLSNDRDYNHFLFLQHSQKRIESNNHNGMITMNYWTNLVEKSKNTFDIKKTKLK